MTTPAWRQVTVTFPDPRTAAQAARIHLAPILAEAERRQLITTWFYVRKGRWRLRYTPATMDTDRYVTIELERLTREDHLIGAVPGTYEPETYAFGGAEAIHSAHQLWHHDSRHLLLDSDSATTACQSETSIMLAAVMMRAAGLDWYEQGDVWARVADHRDSLQLGAVAPYLGAANRLLTVDMADLTRREGSLAGYQTLMEAYASTGETLRNLNQTGQLQRGLRYVLAHHVIFMWNRRSIPGQHQAVLATAAKTVIFGPDPACDVLVPDGAS